MTRQLTRKLGPTSAGTQCLCSKSTSGHHQCESGLVCPQNEQVNIGPACGICLFLIKQALRCAWRVIHQECFCDENLMALQGLSRALIPEQPWPQKKYTEMNFMRIRSNAIICLKALIVSFGVFNSLRIVFLASAT